MKLHVHLPKEKFYKGVSHFEFDRSVRIQYPGLTGYRRRRPFAALGTLVSNLIRSASTGIAPKRAPAAKSGCFHLKKKNIFQRTNAGQLNFNQ